MPLAEFWRGDPRLVRVYREAESYRVRRSNAEAWRNGLYLKSAIECTVGNALLKKGSKPIQYMSEPLPITEAEQKEREERQRREQEEKFFAAMAGYAARKTVHST